MTTFNVYLPPLGSPEPPAETFKLVPDKKSALALIFPFFWLLYHRLWLSLLAYCVAMAFVLILVSIKPHPAIGYLSGLVGIYLLLEGQELVRARLERMGWRFAGIVEGENKEEAEIRFLASTNLETISNISPISREQELRPRPQHGMNKNLGGLFPE